VRAYATQRIAPWTEAGAPWPAAPWASCRDEHARIRRGRSRCDVGMPGHRSTTLRLLVGAKTAAAGAAGASAPLGMVEGKCFGFARARWFEGSHQARAVAWSVQPQHLEQQLLVTIDHHLLGESDFGLDPAPRPIISCVLRSASRCRSQPARRYLPPEQQSVAPGSISSVAHPPASALSGLAMAMASIAPATVPRSGAQAHHVGRR